MFPIDESMATSARGRVMTSLFLLALAMIDLAMTGNFAAAAAYSGAADVRMTRRSLLSGVGGGGRLYDGNVLHRAVAAGDAAAVRALLESGEVDVDEPNEFWHKTPLIIAAELGFSEIARDLLRAGASVSEADSDGDTALHEAAFNGFSDIVRMLVTEGGADVGARDLNGSTPADDARRGNRFAVASYLDAIARTQREETSTKPAEGQGPMSHDSHHQNNVL